MAAIYTTLFWCAIQVTLFLALAAPIYLFVRRRSPHAATFAAATSLAAVILLSALAASPWPRWSLAMVEGKRVALANDRSTITDVAGDQAKASATNAGVPLGAEAAAKPASPLAALWEAVQFAATPSGSAMTAPSPADKPGLHWSAIVSALFVVGMTISGVHLVAGLVAVRRLIASSRPLGDATLATELASLQQQLNIIRSVSLHESTEIATPATVGWRRPAILLPAVWRTWSDVERRAVLAHELAHIAQHDFAAWLVARGAIVVHFYHPLVRWFASRLQLDQELAADAAAVRLLGDRQQYLHALANLALATPMHRIAGPARTFIPGRSLLVRRVEMLRTNVNIRPTTSSSSTLRWAIAPALAALAIVAGGLRGPATPSLHAAESENEAKAPAQPRINSGYDFAYVPNDLIFLCAIRPSEIAASPHLRPLAELLNEIIRPRIKVEMLDQLTLVMPAPARDVRGESIPGTGSEFTLFRTHGDIDFKPLIEASYGTIRTDEYKGRKLIAWADPELLGPIEFYSPVAGTLISTPRARLTQVIDNPKAAEPPAAAAQWMMEAKGPMFGVFDVHTYRKSLEDRAYGDPFLQMFKPITDLAEQAIIGVEDGNPLTLRVSVVCRNPEDAARVEQTVEAAIVILKNMLASQREKASSDAAASKPAPHADMLPLLELADQLLGVAEVKLNGARVEITATLKDPQQTIARVLVAPIWAARQAAARVVSINNLRQLGLAAVMYADRFGSFPPAVVYGKSVYGELNRSGDAATDVPRSWRVELLPLLNQEELYREYRLDQPWDSEANLAVLRKMPAIFRSPNDELTSTNSSYFALTGSGTVFDGNKGTKLQEIEDGTSATLLFAEAKRPVPWTKPEDVPYYSDQPVPALGGWRPDEFVIVLCDGSAYPVANGAGVDKNTLKPWIDKSDGQIPPPLGTPATAR